MKVSHVLYKVNDLEKAVQEYEADGFTVEYGKSKNPYNALIYFSEGPYLELFQRSGMPSFAKCLLRLFGHSKMVDRMNSWEQAPEGLIAVALENYKENLEDEINILKKYNQKFFKSKSKRLDTKGRLLEFSVLFPNEMKIPFLMTYFNINPKPKNFVHANGVRGIKSISFGTDKKYYKLIQELCNDPILKLYEGYGVKDMIYEKE